MLGTYNVSDGNVLLSYSESPSLQDSCIGTTGNIVITSFTSTTVSGTFQFTGTDLSNITGTVTNGQFQADYTEQ